MAKYSELLNYIKELAERNELINTITRGNIDMMDLEKENIFPLLHVDITQAQFTNTSTVKLELTLSCVSERLLNNNQVNNNYWGEENDIDNFNETLEILNFLWSSIYKDWDRLLIGTDDNVQLQKIEYERGNILDGWQLVFWVEIPNDDVSIC